MKKQYWLLIVFLVLMSISLCGNAEMAFNPNADPSRAELVKEGDTFVWKGPLLFTQPRGGWREDGSLYITNDGMLNDRMFPYTGMESGKAYCMTVFVPRSDGTYGSVYVRFKGSSFLLEEGILTFPEPGLYEGIVAVFTSEDGEVYEHTFDVLYDPLLNDDDNEYRMTPEKKYFDTVQEEVWELLDEPLMQCFVSDDQTLPTKGIRICADDRDRVAYSGIESMTRLSIGFAVHKKANLKNGLTYTMTLTELATGKSVSKTESQSWAEIKEKWQRIEKYVHPDSVLFNKYHFSIEFDLPADWQEGEYELKIEADGVGEDTIRVQMRKEFNPLPVYWKYCPELLLGDLGWANGGSINYSDTGYLQLSMTGLKKGQNYYALLQYTTPEGQTFTQHRALKPHRNSYYENFLITSVAGTYENIQLTVVGGGEIVLSHTFDFVAETSWNTESPEGLVFGLDNEMKSWVFMGDNTLSMEDYETESGFFVPSPRPGVYQVTPAEFYSIYVYLAFNGEPEKENLIIALIKAEDAGKPLEECAVFWKSWTLQPPYEAISGDGAWPDIDKVYQTKKGVYFYGLPGNIPSGDYQLVVQLGDKTETIDITLQIIDEEMVMEEIRKAEEK